MPLVGVATGTVDVDLRNRVKRVVDQLSHEFPKLKTFATLSPIPGFMPWLRARLGEGEKHSTLEHLEHRLHPWVMLGIVPLFGFVSAGVQFPPFAAILRPLPLAVMLGLFVGKQLGIFAAIRIGDAFGVCCRPQGASWPQIYGASVLCGIGFTMSFFIGAIAAPEDPQFVDAARVGTLVGTALAALTGWAVLRACSPVPWVDDDIRASLRLFAFSHSDDRLDRKASGASCS